MSSPSALRRYTHVDVDEFQLSMLIEILRCQQICLESGASHILDQIEENKRAADKMMYDDDDVSTVGDDLLWDPVSYVDEMTTSDGRGEWFLEVRASMAPGQ